MAIKSSGSSLSFTEIYTEFGLPPGKNLGAYRLNGGQTVGSLTDLPLDTDIPRSGPIKFSDFYSKKLNIVVNLHSGDSTTREDARSLYDFDNVTVIGGFITKPDSNSPDFANGKKVIINVNKIVGSEKTGRNYAALKTGTWNANTNLELVVGPSGAIYGAGGDGGRGGDGSGSDGGQGTTALAIQYPVAINNQGTIFAGRGGGGGGAGGIGYKHADTQRRRCQGRQDCVYVAGGGGAGGAGYPGGTGAVAGNNPGSCRGVQVNAGTGGDGNLSANGGGGGGGYAGSTNRCDGPAVSGAGGGAESSGGGGNNASGNPNPWSVGSGGNRGYAVIIDSTGSLISYTGNARDGDTFTSAQVGASV
jgi:hypothetical protein